MDKKAVALGVLSVLAVFFWLALKKNAAEKAYAVAQAMTVKADLPAFTVLKEEMVEVKPVPRADLQRDAYEVRSVADLKLVNGLITVADIPKGGQITESSLLKKDDERARAGAFREPAQRRYLEGLKYFHEGDFINAYAQWRTSKMLDPSGTDAAAALRRLEQTTPSTLQDVIGRETLPDYAAGGAAPYRLLAVVAARDLPAYTILKEGMLKAGLFPAADLRPDAFVVRNAADIGALHDLITVKDISAGAPVGGASMLGRAALKSDPAAYREPARKLYLEGQGYFERADYRSALEKWWVARALDPANAEAAAAFAKAEKILAGRKRGK